MVKELFPDDSCPDEEEYREIEDHPYKIVIYKDQTHRKQPPNIGDFYHSKDGQKYVCASTGIWIKLKKEK